MTLKPRMSIRDYLTEVFTHAVQVGWYQVLTYIICCSGGLIPSMLKRPRYRFEPETTTLLISICFNIDLRNNFARRIQNNFVSWSLLRWFEEKKNWKKPNLIKIFCTNFKALMFAVFFLLLCKWKLNFNFSIWFWYLILYLYWMTSHHYLYFWNTIR